MLIAQRLPIYTEDIAEYRRGYAALVCDFHQDMTLVEYYGLRLRNRPESQREEDRSSSRGITLISSKKLINSPYLLSTNHPNAPPKIGYRS
jgi:hypothetical protein